MPPQPARRRRGLPADLQSEESVIGAAMLSPQAFADARSLLCADDFLAPRHQIIWQAMVDLGDRIDPVQVAARLADQGHSGDGYTASHLTAYTVNTPSVSSAVRYARIVLDHAVRRKVIAAAAEVTDLAYTVGVDSHALVAEAGERFTRIDVAAGNLIADPTADEFLQAVDMRYDWLVPHLLERGDRLLMTGSEGAGKSTLLRQIAVMCAAGLHPWTRGPITPVNVALIDCENGGRQVARSLNKMKEAVAHHARHGSLREEWRGHRLRICSRPEGIDLTTRTDRRWLIERCLANDTELLVIGPLYRLFAGVSKHGDLGGEDQARTVTAALDEVRRVCGTTLVVEAHSPLGSGGSKRDLRPFGSSVWIRWPEFGVGLARRDDGNPNRDYELVNWREPRDQRTWPGLLLKGGYPWPWMTPVSADDGEM